jgi:addiction module HigA family antidote
LREFLQPLGITQTAFAKHIGITNARLSEIIHGKRPVTMDSALRFERALGFSAESWMRMQMTVDMYAALRGPLGKAVGRIKPLTRVS